MTATRLLGASVVLLAAVFGPTRFAYAQDTQGLELLHVQGNVSMLAGAGGNIAVQVGKDGILLVDAGAAAMTDKVVQTLRTLSRGQVTYIVNTNERSDHVGGNANFARLGRPLAIARAAQARVFIVGFSTMLERMTDPAARLGVPEAGWLNDTYSGAQKNLSFNGDAVQIYHQAATTDSDSVVLFRRADVIATGDIFTTTQYPFIDTKAGGTVQGEIEALNNILDRTVYEHDEEGGTMIIPGHGRVCDEYEVSEYRDMIVIIRDRIQALLKTGATLEQVKAARPTADFDDRYGANTGPWTTDMFVEAVYSTLASSK